VLAVRLFRSSSLLRGDKDKDKAEEAVKKDNKDATTSGANAQGKQTTGPTSGPAREAGRADSGRRGSNALGATVTASQGEQSVDGAGKKPSDEGSCRPPKLKRPVPDDVEQGLGAGVGPS
jgi:hypothetical protein